MKGNLKRISVDKLRSGMFLGTDVINSNGIVLIGKNTVISEKIILRMKLYQITSVVIIEQEQPEPEIVPETIFVSPIDEQVVSVAPEIIEPATVAFNEFKEAYTEKQKIVQEKLLEISNGGNIPLDDLLDISTSLLSSLKTKSDLFNYLYNLRVTDDYTYSHSVNVALLCNVFGFWLNLKKPDLDNLTIAGLLHDIGKVQVNQRLLNKPGKLTKAEFDQIKMHAKIGYLMVQDQNISEDIKYGILMHHEKMDGSGYPLRLKDEDINRFGKIIGIVDIYDAMTSNRSYHKKFSPFQVIHIFEKESFGLLDLKYLFVFLENIAHNYVGKMVRLSNGVEGKIFFINKHSPSRPLIQVGDEILDLSELLDVTIEEIL
ncbi:MAG: HD-GYP domain-containing protein [Vallitaleaceae bacterium]|nr:HD-GYP domain-containing protein [Vallitaleaceae bacterium]